MLSKQIDEHVQRNRLHDASTAFDDRRWVPTPTSATDSGFAQMAERQYLGYRWRRSTGDWIQIVYKLHCFSQS